MSIEDQRTELISEANELGLEFPFNIPTKKLVEKIAEFKGEPVPVDETPPKGPKVSEEKSGKKDKELDEFSKKRLKIAKAKAEAMKTKIVTLTNKDNRENEFMTTAFLSMQNQHFGISRVVPLDTPVQLEQCLISIAEGVTMTLHKDEIKDGVRTGNKITTTSKKYAISYGSDQTEQ